MDICNSLLLILPKLHGELPQVYLISKDVLMLDQCVLDIAWKLRKAVLLYTLENHYKSRYRSKLLKFYDRFDQIQATEFLRVPKKDLFQYQRVLISGAIDCDAAVMLIQAMETKPAIAKRLVLHLKKKCKNALANVKYSKNTVKLIFL